ncbi:TetR/AcrR family transcriptional regulator [Citricoccus muralis]|uniref:TetR/AcrR family transcriptional regulator n=1 Tax=Citricoccus muralis TaxID=169134 RepID=A0ABY8H6N6_9MICC|nr:TetR/AcrR family transcriptional regulator [Citricoccus muralis]WFP16681.1 TetR/AcrR family transcriptional regulator [Citricoccus muralis]
MADTTDTGLPRAIAIAWGMQEAPQRGPSRGLSHERIVEAAIAIADAEGLTAVTMQAVARSLGFTTMSLYRYVSSKDELLLLMQDAASALPKKVTLPSGWRAALREWAQLVRAAFRAHPWILSIPRGQVSVLMPQSTRAADLGLAALEELELDDDEKVGVILSVSQFVGSMVELEQNLAREGAVEFSPEGAELMAEVITAERFPHLQPLVAGGHYVGGSPTAGDGGDGGDESSEVSALVEDEFSFGLELLLSGLEALERSRSAD